MILLELSSINAAILLGWKASVKGLYLKLNLIIDIVAIDREDLEANLDGKDIVMMVYMECNVS